MLYHKDLGFPKDFNPKVGTVCLTYNNHAHEASKSDRYGAIVLPRSLNTNKAECIELQLIEGRVSKLVYRIGYSKALDLCIVCKPKGNLFVVLTVWLNLKSDSHNTVNLYNYLKGA